jgi:ABC-type lipoprotein release transport system permease subunit
MRWTLRAGLVPALVGVAVGMPVALALTRLAAAQLYEVRPGDPLVFGAVGLLLIAVSLLAAGVPASRAARTGPLEALRGAD